eukprot:825530-Amphidinium_carterae.1
MIASCVCGPIYPLDFLATWLLESGAPMLSAIVGHLHKHSWQRQSSQHWAARREDTKVQAITTLPAIVMSCYMH